MSQYQGGASSYGEGQADPPIPDSNEEETTDPLVIFLISFKMDLLRIYRDAKPD